MSRLFRPVRQLGYVVPDLDRAMEGWLAAGVGPFFRINEVKTNYLRFRGKDVTVSMRIALANSGDTQIELIEQLDDAPTHWREFLQRYGPGVQHLGFWSETFDADVMRLSEQGFSRVVEGEVHVDSDNGIRYSYFEPGYQPGTMLELVDSSSPVLREMNRIIREAAIDWNGTDPVRDF
ncbi:VOC family protein [Variovorax sp. J31P207]|uniref:VOC family protein n=1 Tax=Variovorax sp. J31P207 TaxID=3053510 RepID=UPI0025757E1E|nr:VOC family protein [Variovorax sp. J31P207]MDM0066988.1 VOC family protein [Variovorax sp. J31P207]